MAGLLIIDDDPNLTELLTSHFSSEGFEVSVAHRAEDGMAQALKNTPDVILLDVLLPDLTGFQMCNRLRRTTATKAIPIIMMSGKATYPNQQNFAFERGANEFLRKPFQILDLDEMVQHYTQKPHSPAAKKSLE